MSKWAQGQLTRGIEQVNQETRRGFTRREIVVGVIGCRRAQRQQDVLLEAGTRITHVCAALAARVITALAGAPPGLAASTSSPK